MPRIEADDEVRRFRSVYLGPPGMDLPWHARYSAYAVGAAVFLGILLIEALTPLQMGVPPVWEVCITVLVTSAVMQAVDHDKPLSAAIANVVNVARAPRPPRDITQSRHLTMRGPKVTRDEIADAQPFR